MTNLDNIVKNYLLKKGYPIHYYLQCLTYAANCLRTLAMDDLHIVNTCLLEVDELHTVDLPESYIDYCRVGIPMGQFIKPLVFNDSYNRLPNVDDTGNEVPYSNEQEQNGRVVLGANAPYWMTVNYNDYGENIGRMFGVPQTLTDTFKVIPERRKIQLNEKLNTKYVVLEYLSSCSYANAATCLTEYAWETIDAYINWQLKEYNRNYNMGERQIAEQQYYNQRKKLRSRLNPIGKAELLKIMNNAKIASIK